VDKHELTVIFQCFINVAISDIFNWTYHGDAKLLSKYSSQVTIIVQLMPSCVCHKVIKADYAARFCSFFDSNCSHFAIFVSLQPICFSVAEC